MYIQRLHHFNYYSICIGEIGVGKSSLINTILKYGKKEPIFNIKNSRNNITKKIDSYYIDYGINKFYFIDTPGLNSKDDKNKILRLKEYISILKNNYYSKRINCILLFMKITDYRFTNSMLEIIKELLNLFPSYNFWEHVIIIRTHTILNEQIDIIKGNFISSIQNNDIIKKIMNEKGIKQPNFIKEFYVDSVKQGNINTNINTKIEHILNEIKNISSF